MSVFLTRVRQLSDAERAAIADTRRSVDEAYHERALSAATELLVGRGEEYVRARRALVGAHVPARVEGLVAEELERWNEVARLVEMALDDALLAVLTSDLLHPDHLRELYRSLKAADELSA